MTRIQRALFNPGISNVRAIVTTKWGNHAYKPKVIRKIESYTVDTALDSDADTWHIEIGDPHGSLVDCLRRDSEVRVQLFGVGHNPNYIMTGVADEVEFGDEGVMTFTGRDLSSLAMDSTVPPKQYKHVRAWSIVAQQARELGFQRTKLSQGKMISKVQHTDGSESYWEFWYRLYRKEKMWIWTEPNGLLRADFLNYSSQPSYYFGEARETDTHRVKSMYIPIDQISVRKSTQSRIAEVWVFAHKGKNNGFHAIAIDPTLRSWQKRPRRIILDKAAQTYKAAMKSGWEEIFEGKVGEIEYTVTIPDPGFLVKQNAIARLRLPVLGLAGDFFVVGVQAQAGPNGAMQRIRLRDRKMALTRRIPAEPKALGGTGPKKDIVGTAMGIDLSGIGISPEWGNYFFSAAKQWHGTWDFNLFLAVLLAMSDQMTSFSNIREPGGPGGDNIVWHPLKKFDPSGRTIWGGGAIHGALTNQVGLYKEHFANEEGDGWVKREFAVGPMQLDQRVWKYKADDYAPTENASAIGLDVKIDSYLRKQNSPMAGYGSTMVSAGKTSNVDPRLCAAIAGAETSFYVNSKDQPPYNAWGWLSAPSFSSWEDSITQWTAYLNDRYIQQEGETTIAEISTTYCPIGAANDPTGLNRNWVGNVSGFYSEMGGDPKKEVFFPTVTADTAAATVQTHDEFQGGRWNPQSNIWVGAQYLADCLDKTQQGSGKDDDIWLGVMAYHRGVADALKFFRDNTDLDAWTKQIRAKVLTDPGYLGTVKSARDQAMQDAGNPAGVGPDDVYDQPPAPKQGKENSEAAIATLTHIEKRDASVDLKDVNWRLLVGINNLGRFLGKTITITSGFRTYKEQKTLWDDPKYHHDPNLVANPDKAPSNHMLGEACDCEIGGVEIAKVVAQDVMEKFGIHCSVYIKSGKDLVHVTRLGIWG